jgi:oligosaccharide translocation protein RFT1
VCVEPQAEKLLLAEGSKLALVALESSYNQGVYGLVANLGSLVVRLLFTPVEEAAFTAFSRWGAPASCFIGHWLFGC